MAISGTIGSGIQIGGEGNAILASGQQRYNDLQAGLNPRP
jgi:hypothetical protein